MVATGITTASVQDKPGSKSLEQDIEDLGGVKKIVVDDACRGMPPFTAQGHIEWEMV